MNLFNNKPKNETLNYNENGDEFMLRIDLADNDEFYYIFVDVPGKKISDIKMKFKGNDLFIRVIEESEEANPIADKSCIIQERLHDETERLISFDEPIDKKSVDARLENGLLSITIKKINPDFEDEEDLIVIKN